MGYRWWPISSERCTRTRDFCRGWRMRRPSRQQRQLRASSIWYVYNFKISSLHFNISFSMTTFCQRLKVLLSNWILSEHKSNYFSIKIIIPTHTVSHASPPLSHYYWTSKRQKVVQTKKMNSNGRNELFLLWLFEN